MKEIAVNKNVLFIAIIAVAVIAIAVSLVNPSSFTPDSSTVVFKTGFGDVTVPVEVASTYHERQQGLMNRDSLEGGMLFIFEKEGYHTFWMKNTLIPLDMIFISKDLRVVSIKNAVPCLEAPCPVYGPEEQALYVVEVNAGFALDSGIEKGTAVIMNV